MTTSPYPRKFLVLAYQRLTRYELEDAKAYARLTTELMQSEAKKHEAYVDGAVAQLSQAERDAYFDNNSDTYELLVRRFPNQQQQSLLVLSYTVFETRLVAVAKSLLKSSNTNLSLKDLAGDSPFQKSRKVITRIAELDIAQKLWDDVDAFRHVRNLIVHNGGFINDDAHPLVLQLLKKKAAEISNSDSDGLTVQPSFVFSFLDSVEALFNELFQKWIEAAPKSAA